MKNFELVTTEPAKLKEFLDYECISNTVRNGAMQSTVVIHEDLTADEIFDLGHSFGRKQEKEIWTAPESFSLPKKYADVLKSCINDFPEMYYRTINGIKTKEISENTTEFICTEPQAFIHLFNLAKEYGERTAKMKAEAGV